MANQTNLKISGEIAEISQGQNKPGRPNRVLTEEEMNNAVLYVKASGFHFKRLCKYLKIGDHQLKDIIDNDADFGDRLEAGNAEFIADTIKLSQRKDPSFILKTRAKDEFKEDPLEIKITPEEKIKDLIQAIRTNRENERPATVQGPSPSDVQESGGQAVPPDGGAS